MTRTPFSPGIPNKPDPKPDPSGGEDPYLRAARKFPTLKAQATERLSRRTEARNLAASAEPKDSPAGKPAR